ncbi:MAG: diguanylate cyclase [Gammaproteobacteria bacterium]|nr:diguanylate cyclase [Gammaproteobacteria bacterium]
MEASNLFTFKPIKHRIAKGFLATTAVLSFINIFVTYGWEQPAFAIGSLIATLIVPLALFLGRYPRLHWLPLAVAILIPIGFQFPSAIFSLGREAPIFWFIAGPVFFFGLSNLYIGLFLSLALMATLIANFLYSLYGLGVELLPVNTFISLLITYLFVMMLLWINERDRLKEELELNDSASLDFLTKVRNRRGMASIIEQNLSLQNRYLTPCSIILLDLDNFKRVNDRFGHAIGDDVLFNVATLCASHLRETDVLGRWGGEEFVIVAPGLVCGQAQQMAEKLRQILLTHHHPDVGVVTGSFGVVSMRSGEPLKRLLERADEMMYEAKQTKNCVVASE